jgi:uncharacterized protein (TIGR03086 family)
VTHPMVDQLGVALDATGRLVTAADQQWTLPTPCTDWNVRELVNHVVVGNQLFADILSGRSMPAAAGRGPATDRLGDQPAVAYRAAADAVLAAFGQPGVLEQTFTVPFGTVPGIVALHLRITELLVHGWDLATAIGQPAIFPDEIVEQELEFTHGALAAVPATRSPFAAPQPVADQAPPIDRLAALLGRPVPPS